MPEFLLLRLKGPLQAWGDVAMDARRPTRDLPSRSALAGLLASALGWTYRDGNRTTALQDALRYAVREDRRPRRLRDYQTANLGAIGGEGWTRWSIEKRGGAFSDGTHIMDKHYLADGSFLVALTVGEGAPATLDELTAALHLPARPLFLGRRSCPPSTPLLEGRVVAASAYDALLEAPLDADADGNTPRRCWYEEPDGPPPESVRQLLELWDRRDFATDRFAGSRRVVQGTLTVASGAGGVS